jgi:hypothetical protein
MKSYVDSLITRLTELPRPEIEQVARVYEARANGTPNARNNVSAKIAIALRLHLENQNAANCKVLEKKEIKKCVPKPTSLLPMK